MSRVSWRTNAGPTACMVELGIVKVHSSHKALLSITKGQCGTVDVHVASRWIVVFARHRSRSLLLPAFIARKYRLTRNLHNVNVYMHSHALLHSMQLALNTVLVLLPLFNFRAD